MYCGDLCDVNKNYDCCYWCAEEPVCKYKCKYLREDEGKNPSENCEIYMPEKDEHMLEVEEQYPQGYYKTRL